MAFGRSDFWLRPVGEGKPAMQAEDAVPSSKKEQPVKGPI